MAIIVQKYGGSSVADLAKLSRVADWVVASKRAGHSLVVVVSAMGKTTDELLSLAQRAAQTAGDERAPARRELDMLLSVGERTTMALLSIAIQARGEAAVSLTGSQSGIITNDRHFDARIIEVRPHRIEDELYHGKIVIVAGYQGMSYRREITTLGRGGSDTTAVALAAALGAERCEIYSDVDGIYSADPRTVADARHLPEVDYETMQEMAESGAKVLNARAVAWARRHNVAIYARKTADFADHGAGRETRISGAASAQTAAIVVDGKVAWVEAPLAQRGPLLAALEHSAIPILDAFVGERMALSLSLTSVPDFSAARASLLAAGATSVRSDVALVSAVAVGVGREASAFARALLLVPSTALATSLSPLRLSALVPTPDAPALERAWHALLAEA